MNLIETIILCLVGCTLIDPALCLMTLPIMGGGLFLLSRAGE